MREIYFSCFISFPLLLLMDSSSLFFPLFLVQEAAGWNGTLILVLLPHPCIYIEVEGRTEHPFRAKGCFIGINNKKRESKPGQR